MISHRKWQSYLEYKLNEREEVLENSITMQSQYRSPMSPLELSDNVSLCQHETELSKRLSMLQDLLHRAPGASKPYIQLLIRKTYRKIQESDELPF
jgi:hypothetical protein